MQWSSDSKWLIQDVNSKEEPSGWDSRYGCLAVRQKKSLFNWCFHWHNRDANQLADRLVKLSFNFNQEFYFVNPTLSDLPNDMSSVLFSDSLGLSGL